MNQRIIDGNITIMLFEGYKRSKNTFIHKDFGTVTIHGIESGFVKYYTSWDWLMPVVNKISEIYNQADEVLAKAINEYNPRILWLRLAGPSRELVWESVVDFIEWYNSFQASDTRK